MTTANVCEADDQAKRLALDYLQDRFRHGVCVTILVTLLGLGTTVVYLTGGTAYAYPYLMLTPVLLAAAWYQIPGAVSIALAAGLLMAAMPLNVDTATTQSTGNWLIRLGLYLGLGIFTGYLFQSLKQSTKSREAVMRIDPGSNLPNLLALRKALKNLPRKPFRHNGDTALILVRITDITDVLVALGIDASDELLAAVAARITKTVPASARVYRIGDSELMLLLTSIGVLELEQIVKKLITIGEDNLVIQEIPMRAQVVLGSTIATDANSITDTLIAETRMALFAAIERQRSHFLYSPNIQRRTLENIQLIARVREGLNLGEFELHYQPKIRLSDGRVSGCEGLIRWRGASGELIPPGQFMPKVESTTLIAPVTEFVSRTACAFAASAADSGVVSINFSVHNLFDENLVTLLATLLKETELPPHRLEIEITESVLAQGLEAATQAVKRIRSFGIGVSIDDFGTGFASFEYLQHLPVTGLKIDRAFIINLEHDNRAKRLVACMIDMGHALDMAVTAEGVETEGQRNILRALKCDQAQGFFYSPALPAQNYQAWCHHYAQRQQLKV
ncbi:putative bifunctional diguanylate cyclase/phosphodiesterase [Marinobacter caseinilyticus]|uniref:putative bifunctional diguanylate cyclase/phosphodiesterase n=1 Tax=Marinobacter caseinilyticus TaxID=2692195 RepID=UPI00140B3840|nr:GGDEF domain-containing phosphodiesterase [Marinobacter caseinilyticus]